MDKLLLLLYIYSIFSTSLSTLVVFCHTLCTVFYEQPSNRTKNTMSFLSSNMDEILNYLFDPFYFFTGIVSTVNEGRAVKSDEFHGL